MYETIKKETPNIPEEVIRSWLLPFAEELSWPPKGQTWNLRLGMEPIEFWNDADWQKEKVNLPTLKYSKGYFSVMQGLHEAYIQGKNNNYLQRLGEKGKARFQRSYQYILKNQKFPQPPILYPNELGEYEIIDGNHRFFALVAATRTSEEILTLPKEQQRIFLEKMQINKLLPPYDLQEVWVCYPKWENSENALLRNHLRNKGIDFI